MDAWWVTLGFAPGVLEKGGRGRLSSRERSGG